MTWKGVDGRWNLSKIRKKERKKNEKELVSGCK